ncbi:DUF1211 domain-containing protein [Limosilactobacillus sp. STM2_1]|uniref:DUF1211 domain-containing protein n=1 Tax=Limosilactobacillus rudii TaxID=2759755 RepID=A0A7W3YLN2_9LACO|nr:TMEM175 family protein [Limosilactobacillus rudii]MBB1078439.1 DUF1211 domain-containing protein [Limosilactobacillus rudii]MBB1096569.1 DUF1211 domain-containing protein [Limosilactobacillus rudii]MCD7134235.1 TMEM175 family protein [Limosilactobacillus rudii]
MKTQKQHHFPFESLPPDEQKKFYEVYEQMKQVQRDEPNRLREHLEAFNDAILAIVATIIVLEIKPPIGEVNYAGFLSNLLIFLISFAIIADFWYNLHLLFSFFVIKPDSLIVILDLCLLADLALMPTMTKWIMSEASGFAVMNYGIIYLIACIIRTLMQYLGFKNMGKESKLLQSVTVRHSMAQFIGIVILNAVLIAFAFYYPKVVMILYLATPIISGIMMNFQQHKHNLDENN